VKHLFHSVACIALLTPTPFALAQSAFTPLQNLVPGLIDESERVTLKGNISPLAQPEFDRGSAAGSTPTGRIRLLLKRSATQQQALSQYLDDLQNPASAAYHKWLTPAQYGGAYGVSGSDLSRVQAWLESHGFKIEKTPESGNVVEFSGTLDQVERAFHTAIHRFAVNGQTHFANINDPQIPAALAPVIAGVGPLNDFRPKPSIVRGPGGHFDESSGRIVPDLTLSGGSVFYLFVDPADAAVIYDTPNSLLNPAYSGTSYDGTGISLGIIGGSDLTSADVANYRMAFLGESSGSVNLPTVVVDGNDPGLTGGGTEALLDTEVAGGIAPKAKIYFYTSADSDISSGIINAIFRALSDNTVSILSLSLSECEADLGTTGNQLILEAAQQAAAQGITFVVSAGDNGSAGCDNFDTASQAKGGFAVNGFASTPYGVAVGGTDFDVLSASFATYVNETTSGTPPYYETALKYIPESPWNDSTSVNNTYANNVAYKNSNGVGNIAAGSGGASAVYAKPAFQSSLTPNDGFRDLPDVSLLAGNGFYGALWVLCSDNVTDGVSSEAYTNCQTSGGQFTSNTTFEGVGGTSASAPAFAGMLALVAQAHGTASDNYRLGQANDVLYQLAQSKYSTVFHDVTEGNNSVACTSGSPDCGSNQFMTGYNAASGYDLASGLGSVNAAAMVSSWTSVSLGSTTTSLKINGSTAAYSGVHGQALTFNVGVTPATASGVVGVVDNADETNGGIQNNGQFAIQLSGGVGSANYNGLPGGSYTVWARYGGDTADASSTSAPAINVTISSEASTTTLAVNAYNSVTQNAISPTNVPYGSYIFADAQITGTSEGANTQGVATGTVTYKNGPSTLGTAAVSTGNQASWPPLTGTLYALPAGSYNLTAQYSGDASFSPSTGTASFTITKAPTTVTSGYLGAPVQYGDPEQIAANVSTSSIGIAPTGTFQFYVDGQPVLAPQPIDDSDGYQPNNTATPYAWADSETVYTFLSVGQHTLSAAYSGDSNYASGASVAGNVTVAQAQPFLNGIGWGVLNPPAVIGQQTTLEADLYGSQTGVLPTGSITFYDNGNAISGTVTYSSGESGRALFATMPYTFAATGNQTLTASYSGDINYLPVAISNASISNTVNVVGPFSLSAGSLSSVAPGQSGTDSVTVTPNGGFTGGVNLTCQVTTSIVNPNDQPTCSVSASVTISGSNAATATLTVNTTAATSAAVEHPLHRFLGGAGVSFALVFLFGIRLRARRMRFLLGIFVLAFVASAVGCGGGGSGAGGGGGGGGGGNPGTTAGIYTITVTGTDAATGKITAQTTVTLTVS
jgi:trimeric autotransporter adhesin